MARRRPTPLRALALGLAAGAAGTAVMTGYQELVSRLRGSGGSSGGGPDSWEEAPAPAQVAQRVAGGVFHRSLPLERAGLLANVVHWAVGIGWGAAYGLARPSLRLHPAAAGTALGAVSWGASYATLPAMGLYEPPWRYPAKTLALDVSYHVVYGLGVAAAHRALAGR